ncbi:protein jagged-1-like [Haliotis rufescens]|uniref:protein jagged-1-like n=1 Tax=Haliotis rufescens TaxID=6454 RepID=UPI00201F2B4A|nr:protein jagged-1-like [Haliotis rufescens]XP_048248859.1 protein jagged-1-like [Haliotis rufescens]
MTPFPIIPICLLTVVVFLESVHGLGLIEVKLTHYSNPRGVTAAGRCCDRVQSPPPCPTNRCDPYFIICISETNNGGGCSYAKEVTSSLTNQNTATFTTTVADKTNPLSAEFTYWQGSFLLEVDVNDNNTDVTTSDDYMGGFSYRYVGTPVSSTSTQATSIRLTAGDSILDVEVRARCLKNYFGNYCLKYCIDRDNAFGHFTCDDKGKVVCMSGWAGSMCTLVSAACTPNPCQNAGTCLDKHGVAVCACRQEYRGNLCEFPVTTPSTTTTTTPTPTTTTPPTTQFTTTKAVTIESVAVLPQRKESVAGATTTVVPTQTSPPVVEVVIIVAAVGAALLLMFIMGVTTAILYRKYVSTKKTSFNKVHPGRSSFKVNRKQNHM